MYTVQCTVYSVQLAWVYSALGTFYLIKNDNVMIWTISELWSRVHEKDPSADDEIGGSRQSNHWSQGN